MTSVSSGEVGVASSIEQPESVNDSFIFSAADVGVGESRGGSGIEATASLATLRSGAVDEDPPPPPPREMQQVEGLFSLSVLAPILGKALRRSAVG